MTLLSGVVVAAFALFLLGFGAAIFARPRIAERFLSAFASSARAHYTEQIARLVVGVSLVLFSSEMWQPVPFRLFGWVIVGTTIVLLCIPWQWHRRFARRVVPPAIRHRRLYGLGAAALGGLLIYSMYAAARSGGG